MHAIKLILEHYKRIQGSRKNIKLFLDITYLEYQSSYVLSNK